MDQLERGFMMRSYRSSFSTKLLRLILNVMEEASLLRKTPLKFCFTNSYENLPTQVKFLLNTAKIAKFSPKLKKIAKSGHTNLVIEIVT